MEYDRTAMPANYDAGRGYRPAVMAAWLETIARWVPKGMDIVLGPRLRNRPLLRGALDLGSLHPL